MTLPCELVIGWDVVITPPHPSPIFFLLMAFPFAHTLIVFAGSCLWGRWHQSHISLNTLPLYTAQTKYSHPPLSLLFWAVWARLAGAQLIWRAGFLQEKLLGLATAVGCVWRWEMSGVQFNVALDSYSLVHPLIAWWLWQNKWSYAYAALCNRGTRRQADTDTK